jgi:hypothetical protein
MSMDKFWVAIRKADTALHNAELAGELPPGSFKTWNRGTCDILKGLLDSQTTITNVEENNDA